MIRVIDNFLTNIKNDDTLAARWILFGLNLLFLLWGFFDYFSAGIIFPFIFTIRFFIAIIIAILISPINNNSFNQNHSLYMCVILTVLASVNAIYVLTSKDHVPHIIFQLLFLVVTPQLFNSRPRFYFPVVFTPYVILIAGIITGTHSIERAALFTFTFALFSSISLLIQYLGYSKNRDGEKVKLKFLDIKASREELLNEKNQLIRILCHDLSNSITIVQLSAEHISRALPEESNEIINKALNRITRGISTQQEIIKHVKEKVAIESGKEVIEVVPVNLKIVFEKLNFFFNDQLEKKNITLSINYTKDKSPHVMADLPTLSNHVLNNILSNAIKFSPEGSDIIISSWSDKEHTYITVEDSGIGIPEDILSNIFKANVKTTRKGLNGEKGTGFGMPLAKAYMEKYGGEILIDSKENKGTRITLKFLNIRKN